MPLGNITMHFSLLESVHLDTSHLITHSKDPISHLISSQQLPEQHAHKSKERQSSVDSHASSCTCIVVRTSVHWSGIANAQWETLVSECQVLGDGSVVAGVAGDVDAHQVVCIDEEHVLFLWDVLEAIGVVWEFVRAVGGGGVSEEDALNLVGVGLVEAGSKVSKDRGE